MIYFSITKPFRIIFKFSVKQISNKNLAGETSRENHLKLYDPPYFRNIHEGNYQQKITVIMKTSAAIYIKLKYEIIETKLVMTTLKLMGNKYTNVEVTRTPR